MDRGAVGATRATDRGTCHRCGWTGHVTKVRARERRAVAVSGIGLRLCDECLADLHRRTADVSGDRVTRTGHHHSPRRHVA